MAETEKPDMVIGEELEKLRARNIEITKMDSERLKLQADSIKHITTLATGTIVILATFMDKIPKPLASPWTLEAALTSLLICIIMVFMFLWTTTLIAMHIERHEDYRPLNSMRQRAAPSRSRLSGIFRCIPISVRG